MKEWNHEAIKKQKSLLICSFDTFFTLKDPLI